MTLDCDEMRAEAEDLHEVAARHMSEAADRGRFAPDYVNAMVTVAKIETAAQRIEAKIEEDCDARDA